MRAYYSQITAAGTWRIYINELNFSPMFIDTLNKLSIWGGYDKQTEQYKSWEFKLDDQDVITRYLTRSQFCYTSDYQSIGL